VEIVDADNQLTATGVRSDALLDSIPDGLIAVDTQMRVLWVNAAAESITGILRTKAIGGRCADLLRSRMCRGECPLQRAFATGKPALEVLGYINDLESSDRTRTPVSVSAALLRDRDDRAIGGVEIVHDLSKAESPSRESNAECVPAPLTSRNAEMRRVLDLLPRIAASTAAVLILGETGTGKELVARAIHALGPRRRRPFIAINCGGLPDTLLESELFGYKRGAFTGAIKDKPGRFALASGGTLFLDEIGDLSLFAQTSLLRVFQEYVYEPLGGTHQERTDARIILATNKDLREEIRKGVFRPDLYYRINVLRLELPPLHRRREDIPALVGQFIDAINRVQHRLVQGITPEALSVLTEYAWPGNVRELKNVIEQSFLLCMEGLIGIEHLPRECLVQERPARVCEADPVSEVEAIRTVLERNDFNRLAAARQLGIHKATLYRKIRRAGIIFPKKRDSRRAHE
jgi:transcriptional regulator with PAS, ATPase and Fis domain